MAASNKRWRQAARLAVDAVREQDILGLAGPSLGSLAYADKIGGFSHWLTGALNAAVLGHDGSWMAPYIHEASELAAKRAKAIGASSVRPPPALTAHYNQLAVSELRGIFASAVQHGARAVATALASRQGPAAAAREVQRALQSGQARSRLMADYITSKAFTGATVEHFRAAGISKVGVAPERYAERTKGGTVRLRKGGAKRMTVSPPWFKPDIGEKKQAALVTKLSEVLPHLAPDDRKLASQLILASTGSRGLSAKQAGLAGKLIGKVGGPAGGPEVVKNLVTPEPKHAIGAEALAELIGEAEKAKAALEENDMVEVLTAGDDLVCEECQEISEAGPYDLDTALSLIPAHPNSFLPGTRIQVDILAALKAFYSGPAIEIVTRSGERLCVTVNHPVMTRLGAIAAGDLRQGMQFLRQCPVVRIASQAQVVTDHDDSPPVIEQVFETLWQKGFVAITPSANDLHGDARCVHGDIHIVCADRRLLGYVQAFLAKSRSEFAFPESDELLSRVAGGGGHRSFGKRTFTTPDSSPGFLALAPDSLFTASFNGLPLSALRCGTPAHSNAIANHELTQDVSLYSGVVRDLFERLSGEVTLDQLLDLRFLEYAARSSSISQSDMLRNALIDDSARQAEFLRDLMPADAGEIESDDIIYLRRFEYVGHVYDVQSTRGWITTPNIACFQCRCALVPADDARFAAVEKGDWF
jgi:hypothetical protein